jgi:Flp pilus assembly protein TadG
MLRMLRNEDGASAVEFAIVMLLFVTLLFGIVEFGLIMNDYLTLSQAAREGARSASLGSPTSTVTTRIQNTAPTLPPSSITITLQTRTTNPSTGSWTTLGNNSNGQNSANSGDQIMVNLTYPHKLITGNMLTFLGSGKTTLNLNSQMIMRRE